MSHVHTCKSKWSSSSIRLSRRLVGRGNTMAVRFLTCLMLSALLCVAHGLDPEVNYSAIQLITSKGYPAEAHWVTTPDGYILGLHRIPGPRPAASATAPPGPRPVFFLQHGLLCSSTNWLTNLVNESFAYILADAGFDVWMGNVRGNTYSKNHTKLKTNSHEFWDFSFDQHALVDLPTMLDYVMKVTGQTEMFYAGHSQGTVMGFAGFTSNQTLAQHIKAFFALAPVTTVKHIKGLFAFIADFYKELDIIFEVFGDGEFFPNNELIKILGKYVCPADMELEGLCENVLFLICGFDQANMNMTRLPVYYTHTPAGTSVKNCAHFAQEVKSGRFAKYDYGSVKNKLHYGSSVSPSYNLTTLSVPTALFSGGQDWLADPQDVAGLIPKINTTGKVFYHKYIEKYDHLDFIWGIDAPTLVYHEIVNMALKMLN